MKILHVIPSLSPAHGGPSKALPVMEQALRAQGIHVETATTDDDGPGKRLQGLSPNPVSNEQGQLRWYFPKQTEFYKCSWPLYRWLQQSLQAGHYDLVHIHALFSFASTAAARAARQAGVPYIIRPLGVLNRYGMQQRRALFKQLSWKLNERHLVRQAAMIHFTSTQEQEEAALLGTPMRSVIIPLCVDANFSSTPRDRENGPILYLSRIDPKKNIESLLQAWKEIEADYPHRELQIAGSGDAQYEASLRQMAHQFGLQDRVRWLGHVEGTQKQELLQHAAVFILPSYSENFGIAAVEALAAGAPTILSHGVAVCDQAAQAGACIATSPEPAAIAKALRTVLDSTELPQQLSTQGQLHARQYYSPAAMGKRLKDLYTSLLAS